LANKKGSEPITKKGTTIVKEVLAKILDEGLGKKKKGKRKSD